MSERSAALDAYCEQVDAWERMGVISDAPEYEEWLEQQYAAHLLTIEIWRQRWKRKAERVHELERLLSQAQE